MLIQSIYQERSTTYVSARSRNDTQSSRNIALVPEDFVNKEEKGSRTNSHIFRRQPILVIQWYIKSPSQPEFRTTKTTSSQWPIFDPMPIDLPLSSYIPCHDMFAQVPPMLAA